MHERLYSYQRVQGGRLTEKVLGGFSVAFFKKRLDSYGKIRYTL